jgi:hypothetical protein
MLPDDVVGFVKLDEPGLTVKRFLSSSVWNSIKSTPVFQALKQAGKFKELEEKLAGLREISGKEPLDLFDALGGGGVIVGARLLPPEIMVVTRSRTPADLNSAIETLKKILRSKSDDEFNVETVESEGIEIQIVNHTIAHAVIDDALIISNSRRAVEDMIDCARGKSKKTLRRAAAFAPVFEGKHDGVIAMAAARSRFLPNFDVPEKIDNPVVSLLVGGWIGRTSSE